jgi:hypothetical protein
MAGGVITTTIRGADDIDSYLSGSLTEHHRDSDYIQNEYNKRYTNGFDFINEITYDPMPDEYTYSLPGHSGTIEVSFDNLNFNLFCNDNVCFRIFAWSATLSTSLS